MMQRYANYVDEVYLKYISDKFNGGRTIRCSNQPLLGKPSGFLTTQCTHYDIAFSNASYTRQKLSIT